MRIVQMLLLALSVLIGLPALIRALMITLSLFGGEIAPRLLGNVVGAWLLVAILAVIGARMARRLRAG